MRGCPTGSTSTRSPSGSPGRGGATSSSSASPPSMRSSRSCRARRLSSSAGPSRASGDLDLLLVILVGRGRRDPRRQHLVRDRQLGRGEDREALVLEREVAQATRVGGARRSTSAARTSSSSAGSSPAGVPPYVLRRLPSDVPVAPLHRLRRPAGPHLGRRTARCSATSAVRRSRTTPSGVSSSLWVSLCRWASSSRPSGTTGSARLGLSHARRPRRTTSTRARTLTT